MQFPIQMFEACMPNKIATEPTAVSAVPVARRLWSSFLR